MLNEKFVSIKEGFKEELLLVIENMKTAYIPIAGYSFDEEWHLLIPSEIGDAITTISVFALESTKEITDRGLETLNEMCLSMIKRDKWGYDVSRLAARIGVIGTVALSKNEIKITEKAATMFAGFEASYQANSPKPQKGEAIEEMRNLLNEKMLFHNETYLNVYQKLENSSIEEFIKLLPQK